MTIRAERRSVTINDVAQVAGVSRAAVSKVIRNAPGVSRGMRERVTAAIAELDYRPQAAARAMRGLSYRLGLEIPNVSARFMGPLVDGANKALAGSPYQLLLAPATGGAEYGAIDTLADGLVDGIIAVSPTVDHTWLENLAARVPLVMLGRHDDDAQNYDNIVGDDIAGAREVMRHLFQEGHRRIAHLTEGAQVTDAKGTPHSLRMKTYIECMTEAGLGSEIQIARRGPGPDRSREETVLLLAQSDPPTAIFAGHDDIAIAALAGVVDSGRRREEIAVVGYDNTDVAAHPFMSLTSVDQQGDDMGFHAASMLIERIQGRTEPRQRVVTPTLHVRESSSSA